MNMTATVITAIICITIAYISTHGDGGSEKILADRKERGMIH